MDDLNERMDLAPVAQDERLIAGIRVATIQVQITCSGREDTYCYEADPNVAEGIAAGNRTSLSGRSQWQRKRDGETDKCQQLHAPSLSTLDC